MKKLFVILAAAALMAGCAENSGNTVPSLRVEGTTLTAGGEPVVFDGISFGWHNLWPRFYNEQAVKRLASEYDVKLVRAAVGADSHALADNPGCHDGYMGEREFALERLYAVVDGAIEAGIYVIVDWHSHTLHRQEACEFFRAVASKYAGVPNVIYELFNEPVCRSFEASFSYDDLGNPEAMNAYWQDLKAYAAACIDVIKSVEGGYEPLILMGCPSWDQRIDFPAADPIEGYDNLMYTVHFYAATHKDDLRAATLKAVEGGTPVFISECAACEASGNGEMDMASWEEWCSLASSKGISIARWSVSDKDETCSMFTPEALSEGPWTPEVIKPWGKLSLLK